MDPREEWEIINTARRDNEVAGNTSRFIKIESGVVAALRIVFQQYNSTAPKVFEEEKFQLVKRAVEVIV